MMTTTLKAGQHCVHKVVLLWASSGQPTHDARAEPTGGVVFAPTCDACDACCSSAAGVNFVIGLMSAFSAVYAVFFDPHCDPYCDPMLLRFACRLQQWKSSS